MLTAPDRSKKVNIAHEIALPIYSAGLFNGGGSAVVEAGSDDAALAARNSRLREKIKRQARTHSLLVSIVIVFALSWFPLNLFNLILDALSTPQSPALEVSLRIYISNYN